MLCQIILRCPKATKYFFSSLWSKFFHFSKCWICKWIIIKIIWMCCFSSEWCVAALMLWRSFQRAAADGRLKLKCVIYCYIHTFGVAELSAEIVDNTFTITILWNVLYHLNNTDTRNQILYNDSPFTSFENLLIFPDRLKTKCHGPSQKLDYNMPYERLRNWICVWVDSEFRI